MIKKIHRATQTKTETKDFSNYAEACLYGDEVQTITLHDCWSITVYKTDVDGFKKGTIIEPVKQSIEKTDDRIMSIVEHPLTITIHSFMGELHALKLAKHFARYL